MASDTPVVEDPPVTSERAETGHEALQLRLRQQELLAELGVTALKGTPLAKLLDHAARLSAEGLQAEFAKVLEFMPSENRLVMRAGVGWDEGLVGKASIGADLASPSGFALRTGKPVISNHLETEERFRTPDLLAAHGVRRAMNVILQGDGTPFGVLEVDSRSLGEFGEHDLSFLQGAANILGMAIERQRQERALKAAIEHQRVLVAEINHRVKNSLQLVVSMLHLQAGNDQQLKRLLQDASSRVMAIGRAHERLYRTSDVRRINLAEYLSDICSDLRQVIPGELLFEASGPMVIGTDEAIMLALLVSELVANAAKHAYPADGGGPVWVNAMGLPGGGIRVSVRDEGVGMPANAEQRHGLGMRLIHALMEGSHAAFLMNRRAPGTECILEIGPRNEARTS
jgi:two-component sensor histidine kinase